MAKLSLYEIRQNQLQSLPVQNGRIIVCTDTGNMYRDLDGHRIILGASVEKVASLPLAPLVSRIYLLLPEQSLWYYESKWIRIASAPVSVTVQTYADLPSVGSETLFYIVKADNRMYRWDADDLAYYCIGSDYNDIKIINGGTA